MKLIRNNFITTIQTLIIILDMSILFACSEQKRPEKINEFKPVVSNLDNSTDLKILVDSIEKRNCVESSLIGEGCEPSKQWGRYVRLKQLATIDQLIALCNHKNPTVGCYAFQVLAEKHSDKVFTILLKHLNDTSKVNTQNGCIVMTQFTGDYFVSLVTPNRIGRSIYTLNQRERKTLDSILINDKSIKLLAKTSVLKD